MASIKPKGMTLRSYQVGFGDCFLLSFHYDGGTHDRHVLIDFGSTGQPKGSGDKLMLYRLRQKDGRDYPFGNWIFADGRTQMIAGSDIQMTPKQTAEVAGRRLPVEWQIATSWPRLTFHLATPLLYVVMLTLAQTYDFAHAEARSKQQ